MGMLVITQKPGDEGVVVAIEDAQSKTLINLGSITICKAKGGVKLGFDLAGGLQLSRRKTNAGEGAQTWDQIVAARLAEGWTVIDDPEVAESVFDSLLNYVPAARKDAAAQCGD